MMDGRLPVLSTLNGTPVEVDSRLPLSKVAASCLQKDKHVVNREFFVGVDNMVWGYFVDIGYFSRKIYLSEKAFNKVKATNANKISIMKKEAFRG
jgi:hypothetical protein